MTEIAALKPQQHGELVSQTRQSTVRYYHLEGLDSTDKLTDNSRQVVDSYICEAFGQVAAMTGASPNPSVSSAASAS